MLLSARTKQLFAAVALAAVAVPAGAAAAVRTQSADALLQEINRVRAAYGLCEARPDPRLARAASKHTLDMARRDYFAHGAFASRMARFHVEGRVIGENLAWGSGSYGTAAGVVRGWLESPEHRANLLRPGFCRIGLAEVTTSFQGVAGANVVTADFAGS